MCLTLSLTHCVTKRPHCVINSGAFKEKSVPSPLATNVPELLSYGCGVTLRGTEWMRSCGLSHFSCVQFFVALWTIARWAPLSMGILPARILEWAAMPSHSSILAGSGFFATEHLWSPSLPQRGQALSISFQQTEWGGSDAKWLLRLRASSICKYSHVRG